MASVLLLLLMAFLDTFAVGLCGPVMPSVLRSNIVGANLFSALSSVSNAAALIAAVCVGRLSDVCGRKPAILVSACTSVVGYMCFWPGLANADGEASDASVLLPCCGRVLTTVGRAALVAPMNALLGDMLGPDSAKAQLGKMMGAFGLGFASGNGLGGYLASAGLRWPLGVATAVAISKLVCAMLLPSITPSQRGPAGGGVVMWFESMRVACAHSLTRLLLLLQLLASSSFHIFASTSSLYYRERLGYSSSQLGYLLSFAGWTFSFQTLIVVPWLVKRSSRASSTLILAFICTAIGRLGLATSSWLAPTPTILTSFVVLNLGQGLTSTLLKVTMRLPCHDLVLIVVWACQAFMGRIAPDGERGLLLGLLSSCEKLAGVLAPLAGGPIYSFAGQAAPGLVSSCVALTGACLVLVLPSHTKSLDQATSVTKSGLPEVPSSIPRLDPLSMSAHSRAKSD